MTEPREQLIPCEQAVRQLWEYVENSVPPVDHTKITKHLAICQRCCGELEFVKHLRGLLAAETTDEMPPELIRQLNQFIEEL